MEPIPISVYKSADPLLLGGYDLHIHAAPSPFNRLMDEFDLLKAADEAGMAGIMLKSHYESTAARAQLVNSHAQTKAVAYGGIVLNWPVGGLNPYAVENALIRGAKIVWMPTRDSANSLVSGDMPGDFFRRPGISVLNDRGGLKAEVYAIMEIIKKYQAALATGHLSPEESVLLCREGTRMGVRMILTHPEFDRTVIDVQMQKELAEAGVFIEKCWYNIAEKNCSAEELAAHIRHIGPEHCFLCSDRGQGNRESPVEGMREFVRQLLNCGIEEEEISAMLCKVPRQVLGLDQDRSHEL